jgi:hypothetical protein
MINRCTYPYVPNYDRYGGRGIKVCEQWKTFEGFLADMGDRPGPGYSLEREKADKDYEPGNCRWATKVQQANNRSWNRVVEHQGERLSVAVWAARLGIPEKAITMRLNRGWAVERALTEPWKPKPQHSGRRTDTEARIWWYARNRCHNPKDSDFFKYGAIGITMCARWRESREAFLTDVGPRPSRRHSLDRIETTGGYWCGKPECAECGPAGREPNCRWATSREQINNRRVSVSLSYKGEELPLVVWAERLGVHPNTLRVRLANGWDAEKTLSTPARGYRKKPR